MSKKLILSRFKDIFLRVTRRIDDNQTSFCDVKSRGKNCCPEIPLRDGKNRDPKHKVIAYLWKDKGQIYPQYRGVRSLNSIQRVAYSFTTHPTSLAQSNIVPCL